MSSGNNGCAMLSGIVVLENPRKENPNDSKPYILFDAHLYVRDAPDSNYAGISLFWYYNGSNQHFEDIGTYMVHANIARMEETLNQELLLEDMTRSDYILIGDIIELIPLPHGAVNPAVRPLISISGVVNSVDQERRIELRPNVYASLVKDSKTSKPSMPICTFCPDTPRWNNKPKVSSGTYVSVCGFLHSIVRNPNGMVDRFDVELEKITYMGRPYVPVAASTPSKAISAPNGKRLRFSYGDSATPTVKKRKLSNSSATSSDTLSSSSLNSVSPSVSSPVS